MRLTLKPLNWVDINHCPVTDRIDLVQGNPGTYYAQLWDVDASLGGQSTPNFGFLGLGGSAIPPGQRYCPTSTQTFQLQIQRTMTIAPVPASQDFSTVLVTVMPSCDSSILKWTWSAAQIAVCISGGAYLIMTDSSNGNVYTWTVDHFLRVRDSQPGM